MCAERSNPAFHAASVNQTGNWSGENRRVFLMCYLIWGLADSWGDYLAGGAAYAGFTS